MEPYNRFAIYSRKSKFTGKGESIENQIELCRQYISLHFGSATAERAVVYEDEGFSGGNLERPQFKRMMQAIQSREVNGIVVYRLDRISRNIGDFATLIQELDTLRVKFISIKEQFDTESPMGRAMMYISSVFSQLERETIAERIRDNMHELSKTGRWLGGTTPTGYQSTSTTQVTVDGKRKRACSLQPVPSQLELVTLIYEKFLETGSLTKTETFLLQHHYVTKNNRDFSRFAIKAILSNPVYLIADGEAYAYFQENQVDLFASQEDFDGIHGMMVYNRTHQQTGKAHQFKPMDEWIVSVGKHTGAVAGRVWVAVQARLNSNRDKGYRRPRSHLALLSGLLRCGHCGSFMRPKLTQRKTDDGALIYTYLCERKERSRGGRCNIKNCSGNQLDAILQHELEQLPESPAHFLSQLTRNQNAFPDKSDDYNQRLGQLAKEKADIQQTIKQLVSKLGQSGSAVAEGYIIAEIERLDGNLHALDAQVASYDSLREGRTLSPSAFSSLSKLLASFSLTQEDMSIEQRRLTVRTLVEQVVWDGEGIHVLLQGCDVQYPFPS